jgi:hypothetical protein
MSVFHEPVLVEEVLSFLPRPEGAVYVDGTVGGGGHALRILEESAPDARLIGIDRDDEALGESEKRSPDLPREGRSRPGDFADMETVLRDLGIGRWTESSSTSACPPASWSTPAGDSVFPKGGPWTCAWTGGGDKRPSTWFTNSLRKT